MPIISNMAGIKHIKIAGLPTLFRSAIFNDNPDRVKITIYAMVLRSEDRAKKLSESMFKANGPKRIPANNRPIKEGKFNFFAKLLSSKPIIITNETLTNIIPSLK